MSDASDPQGIEKFGAESMPEEGIEKFGGEPVPVESTTVFTTGVAYDEDKVNDRQDAIDGILAKYPRNEDRRVKELNKKIAGDWNDDFGISYLHIAAQHLPGLAIHGVAEKVALSACDLPNANFDSAKMNASVFTATNLPGLSAVRASLDDTLFPLASLRGADLRDATAVDAMFNFADLTGLRARGGVFTSAFFIRALGLSNELFREMGDFTAARALFAESGSEATPASVLGDVLSARFLDAQADFDVRRYLDLIRVIRGLRVANALVDQKRLEGVIIDDCIISGARMPGRELTGSVFHDVHGRDVVLRGARAAGLIVVNSSLHGSDQTGIWAPGMFAAGTDLRKTMLPGSNLGGSVFFQSELEDVESEGTNWEGTTFVGGTPPELDEKTLTRVRIVQPGELPSSVLERVGYLARAAAALQAPKQSQLPELGQGS